MHVSLELTDHHCKALERLIEAMSYNDLRTCAASAQMCYDMIIALEHLRAALEVRRVGHGRKGAVAAIEEPRT
jgi:hypothetical protein